MSLIQQTGPGLIQGDDVSKELAKYGIRPVNEARSQFIVDLLGALAADIDAIPLTYDAERDMTMAFVHGEYGVRALGIDNLLNISSHIPPTRLRIVKPEPDSSSITLAALGDINYNGKDDPYENNVIYANAQELTLTIQVDQRSGAENHGIAHPGMITVQYENADGDWVTIGEPINLAEAGHPVGTTFEHPWTVTDFDDLLAAGDSVQLRTVTTNALEITTTTPEANYFTVQLDDDVHPVDPKVLVVDLNDDSIVMTNPDSGAPQGTIELIAYTPRRTVPATGNIRVEAKRMNDDAWADIGTVELNDPAGMSGTDTAAITFNGNALADVYVDDDLHIQDSGSYLKWVITVDTTALADTIEMDNLAAAHAASNPDGTSYVELDTNRYMVRAYAVGDDGSDISDAVEGETYTDKFSIDNVDDVAPLGQNIITVAQDGVDVTANDDGSFDVGGLVDKYDPDVDSPIITLTITPGAKRDTYDSVHLHTSLPDGAFIGDVTETAEGSGVYTVMVDVGTIMDADEHVHNDRYLEDWAIENPDEFVYNPKGEVFSFTAYALTEDAAGNVQDKDDILNADLSTTTAHEITVNVQNTYRPDPGVLAITVVNSDGMVNPDSKAPINELTFNAYTYGHTSPSRSSPPTGAVRFEVQRPGDDTWERIVGTVESEMVTDADLDDITTGLTQITQHIALTGGDATLPIPGLMKFSVTVDTRELALLNRTDEPIKLEDTIKRDDAAERDVSLDDNQYRVRAIALTPKNIDHPEYPQVDGVDAHFSLDNVDDVPPLGPTNITDIADHVSSLVANEDDGSFLARGIVDDNVESTKLTFSIEPTAEPITFENGMIRLVQTAPDGTVEELPPVDVSEGKIIVDIGNLANGAYQYYALTADEHENWQVQGEDNLPSPIVTVHVLNFRVSDISDLTVTAVDGESPDRHVLQETVGELQGRFPLKESIAVSFNVNNGSLTVGDLKNVVVGGQTRDGDDYAAGSDAANAFSLMANNLSELPDGWYTPHGRVTIRERFVDFPLATINLDNTGPMITIQTPTGGATVDDSPTLSAIFSDGKSGSGVSDGSGVSAADTVVVSLARLRPEEVVQDEVPIDVDQTMVEQDLDSVVYTRTDKLAGGAYQFTVSVQDRLGNTEPVSVIFAIEGEDPIVIITAAASGQTLSSYDDIDITGFYSGGGGVEDAKITRFTINGEPVIDDVVIDTEKSTFTYTLPAKDENEDGVLEDGVYKVAVEVTDDSGITANTSLTFSVVLPVPTVAIHSPHAGQIYEHGKPIIAGDFTGANPVDVTLSIDGEEFDATVNDNNQFTYTPSEDLSDGAHTVMVVVTDANGRTAETSTDFTINIPGPTVMIHVPAAGQIYDISKPVVTGEFSGFATPEKPVTLDLTLDGEPVAAEISDNGFTYTPADPLDDGEFTLVAVATDANGKTAKATAIFSIRLPVPTVLLDSPVAGGTYDHTYRHISGEFTGVHPIVVELMVDGTDVTAMVNGNEFTYDLSDKLAEGEHTVSVEITDANGNTAQATTMFSVVYPEASVSLDSPVAGGIYDHTYRHISGEFMGVGVVAVHLSVDGEAVHAMVDGNEFTYDLSNKLVEGEHTVSVSVEDANGETAQATTTFSVVYPEASVMISSPVAGDIYDHTYRHITGEFTGVGNVDVSIMVDGAAVDANSISVEGNEFTYMLSGKLTEGDHMVSVSVEDENGETAQATTIFSVVYPEASVMISSPVAGDTYDHTYRHISGEFTGVGAVSVNLSVDGTDVDAKVEYNEFTYDLSDKLTEGDHTISVSVTDENGETAQATTTFFVVYPEASVMISSPVAGDIYDHTYRHITGEFTGVGNVDVSIMVDGAAVDANSISVEGNEFTYMLSGKLTEGDHMVSVSVEDENGETAQATTIFSVVYPDVFVSIDSPVAGGIYDHTYRHISGEFMGVGKVAANLSVDGEAVHAMVDGNEFTYDLSNKLSEGEHTISVSVTDENGETAQASTTFSVVYPEASVSIDSPVAGDTYNHTYRHISGEFMGVGDVAVNLSIDGEAVHAMVDGSEFTYDLSNKLSEGEHTISVSVTDENGETAQASTTFSVVYPDVFVSIDSPIAGNTYDHTYRHISGEFMGVGDVAANLTVDGEAVHAMVDGNEFTYDLSNKLSEGEHTISVSVTDENGETATASTTFSVVYPEASVSIDSPVAGDTYDHTYRHISGEFTGVGTVSVNLSVDGATVPARVDGNEFTYDLWNKLSEGKHTISVSVTDENGETAQASTTFSVVYPDASVMISSPEAGDIYDHTYRHITGEFTGVGSVDVSIMVDGAAVDADSISVEGNEFTYILSDKLIEGDHMVSVSVVDDNGETAQATTIFSVVYPEASVMISSPVAGDTYDHTYRHISGEFTGVGAVSVNLSVDGTDVDAKVEYNEFTYDLSEKLTEGDHTISVLVTDENGETAQATTMFSVVYPDVFVSIDSPAAGSIHDHTYRHISGEFMGVGKVTVNLSVDGEAVQAMVDGNEFTYDLSGKLDEGKHTVSVSVEDENGESATASTTFSVVYPDASVSIDSPAAGHTYDHNFSHISGHYIGVGDVKIVLTVDGKAVPTKKVGDNEFTAESPELAHGDHTVTVEVTDENGETATTSTTFAVDVPGPTVAILSPASGQTYEHGEPVIRVEYTGITDVNVTTFTINGEDVEGIEPEDNAFEYVPAPALGDGEYKVVVEVQDENEKSAKASVVFNIAIPKDTTPPVISEVAPSGLIKLRASDVIGTDDVSEQYGVTISAIITDEQSDIIRVEYAISEGTLRPHPDNEQYQAYPVERADGKFEVSRSLDLGTHQVSLRVESEGGVREFRWQFTLEADTAAPTITSITPSGTIHAGMPPISASAVDNTAVKEMTIVVIDSDGEAVTGDTTDDGDDDRLNQGVTRIDFHPEAPLSEGTYTIEVRATDTYNNSSTATGVFTVDFDTAAPIITSYAPQNGARLIYKHNEVAKPTISITYGDAETGVNVDSVRLSIEGPAGDEVINLTDEQKSASQVVYTPSKGYTEPGQYTVIFEVSDNANLQGNVSEENDDARQANQVVHKFSFFVEYTEAPVLMAPFNFPNPFAENTRISFGLNQMSVVSIVIYDSTLRPVRVLVDNELMPAGRHTGGNGIGWDGKTSSGESLARGIYYAQIVVTGGFEAEYAILTLALTGAK